MPKGLVAVAIAIAAFAGPALVAAPADASPGTTTASLVIVMADVPGAAQTAVVTATGRVTMELPLIGAVLAEVPTDQIGALAALPGVTVAPDAGVSVAGSSAATVVPAPRAASAVFSQATGADQLVARGVTGVGVNVAVLDTGIDPLPDFAGRLLDGVDLSGEGHPFQDNYGHGTFVAGVIAGNGASSGGAYLGEAPGAGLVSVKVAGASGQTDVATVIAGISWVVSHRSADNLGVLNLSLGAPPGTSTLVNPLDRAVEAAWRSGVTVVASAGNAGPDNGSVVSPGDDPLVITVGASDDQGTVTPTDDTMTAFSSVGPTRVDGWFKPDLVAPGRSLVSVKAPGSYIDTHFPSARIGAGNFVGSGTSFSAAVASGAAALLLQTTPAPWKPDVVKAKLLATTTAGPVGNPFVDGHGSLNAFQAAASGAVSLVQPTPILPPAVGGTVGLQFTWSRSAWNSNLWNGSAWNGSAWNGSAWNGSAWTGSAWNGSAWNGSAWNGSAWNGSAWNGSAWNGSAWNGSAWNGSAWNGSAWNGSAWNGSAWNGSQWG